ncbi:MAG: ATP-binding protein [Marinisporobacter sp.]|jgi:signal transduction histidine kinase|nr:ATP-binding protein [Marinisporobacter sp.]
MRKNQKYQPIFKDKNIYAVVQKEGENFKVIGEASKIEQVLMNFINNGIDHIGREKNITICINSNDETVKIGIYNTGELIEEEEMKKIWDSFYKIDKARSREYGGTGLGLSIVKEILKLHHSKFGVLNRDEGVEFWFELRKGD